MSKAANVKRRTRRPAKSKPGGSMVPWYLAAVLTVAGLVIYDHRDQVWKAPPTSALAAVVPAKTVARPVDVPRPVGAVAKPAERPVEQTGSIQPFNGTFYYCNPRKDNCVVDGDTFWYRGEKIRIADIDAPATTTAKCDAERMRGVDAKERMRVLLSAGDFTLTPWAGGGSGEGLTFRVVMRGGRSFGDIMVSEGLARPSTGRHASWC